MGQFKPMVKMYTTEPSVELKLKKGGSVKKADGGMMGAPAGALPSMPARGGMPGAAAPMRPSLAMRRRAMRGMPSAPGPAAPVGQAASMMKKGGKAEGGESKAEHKAEMTKMAKTAKELKKHESLPASKGHKGLKTGGVVNGQSGFKTGGIINTESQGGEYRNTKMHDAEKSDRSRASTGSVKMGNGGGYATGGVAKANAGGYKKGGATKKAYATGGVVDSGHSVAMPQGRKNPSSPVRINQLSGTFKKGGSVTPAQGRLQKSFSKENATAMKQAKAQSNEVYSKYGKRMRDGGVPSDIQNQIQTLRNQRGYENWRRIEKEGNESAQILLPQGKVTDAERKALINANSPAGSVTKTEKSVTVTPGKKRGGLAKC